LILAHDVYFTLNDDSAEARQRLAAACHTYLSGHSGTVFFTVGIVASELDRPVNDRGFGVALHVYLEDKAAHDAYQAHPRHARFTLENSSNWKAVRVFDSWVETAS
jgi:hypothetical protein